MSMRRPEDPLYARCVTEVFDPTIIPERELYLLRNTDIYLIPKAIKPTLDALSDIGFEQFGEERFRYTRLLGMMVTEGAVNVLLIDPELEARIAGYTMAQPTEIAYRSPRFSSIYRGRITTPDTAYVYSTAIRTSHQKHGLVGKLMVTLEDTLRQKEFKFLERDAAVNNGYAGAIRRHYKDRIVLEEGPAYRPPHGPQMFFRIRI